MADSTNLSAILRELPAVQDLLRDEAVARFAARVPRALIVSAIQDEIARARERLRASKPNGAPPAEALAAAQATSPEILRRIEKRLERDAHPGPLRVLNATGIVIHTNLGRSPLAQAAADHTREVALGYSTLEYDLDTRDRGSRQSHIEPLLRELTGAEAALAVNNNAAAVMLALAAHASGKEVIVSRGELVEIGGSFRVPDILRASGARLVEVGTTNRTTAKDYAAAVTPDTAMILKVHPSNFRVVGFVAEASLEELATVSRAAGIPLVFDLGSGLLDESIVPGSKEPSVRRSLAHADLVTFSGDKLLGGPQAGILAGKKTLVEQAKKHALARALRIDKLSLAALVMTARLLLDPARASEVPVVRMITEPVARVEARARKIAGAIASACPGLRLSVEASEAQVGGGSMPGEALASFAIAIDPGAPGADALDAALVASDPPVVARISGGKVLLDARTIADAEIEALVRAVSAAVRNR